jgi:predicted nucleic acid-binding protein
LILLDTSVAILLRDSDAQALSRMAAFPETNAVSILTVVELQGGVARSPDPKRKALLAAFLAGVEILPFGVPEAGRYGEIVQAAGFSRRKLLDRMIAATALVQGLPLATLNPGDFADVAGLEIVDWR